MPESRLQRTRDAYAPSFFEEEQRARGIAERYMRPAAKAWWDRHDAQIQSDLASLREPSAETPWAV